MKNKKNKGFTLLEVIITIVISSIIFIGAYEAFNFSVHNYKNQSAEYTLQSEVRNAMKDLKNILKHSKSVYLVDSNIYDPNINFMDDNMKGPDPSFNYIGIRRTPELGDQIIHLSHMKKENGEGFKWQETPILSSKKSYEKISKNFNDKIEYNIEFYDNSNDEDILKKLEKLNLSNEDLKKIRDSRNRENLKIIIVKITGKIKDNEGKVLNSFDLTELVQLTNSSKLSPALNNKGTETTAIAYSIIEPKLQRKENSSVAIALVMDNSGSMRRILKPNNKIIETGEIDGNSFVNYSMQLNGVDIDDNKNVMFLPYGILATTVDNSNRHYMFVTGLQQEKLFLNNLSNVKSNYNYFKLYGKKEEEIKDLICEKMYFSRDLASEWNNPSINAFKNILASDNSNLRFHINSKKPLELSRIEDYKYDYYLKQNFDSLINKNYQKYHNTTENFGGRFPDYISINDFKKSLNANQFQSRYKDIKKLYYMSEDIVNNNFYKFNYQYPELYVKNGQNYKKFNPVFDNINDIDAIAFEVVDMKKATEGTRADIETNTIKNVLIPQILNLSKDANINLYMIPFADCTYPEVNKVGDFSSPENLNKIKIENLKPSDKQRIEDFINLGKYFDGEYELESQINLGTLMKDELSGTNIGEALLKTFYLLDKDKSKNKFIIFLTDGNPDGYSLIQVGNYIKNENPNMNIKDRSIKINSKNYSIYVDMMDRTIFATYSNGKLFYITGFLTSSEIVGEKVSSLYYKRYNISMDYVKEVIKNNFSNLENLNQVNVIGFTDDSNDISKINEWFTELKVRKPSYMKDNNIIYNDANSGEKLEKIFNNIIKDIKSKIDYVSYAGPDKLEH